MMNDENVHIILKNGFHYNGTIKEQEFKYLILIDKFGSEVWIDREGIAVIEHKEVSE